MEAAKSVTDSSEGASQLQPSLLSQYSLGSQEGDWPESFVKQQYAVKCFKGTTHHRLV